MISVYPSCLEGEPLETHPHRDTTLIAWLRENVGEDFDPEKRVVTISVNGETVDDLSTVVRATDDVRIYPLPKNDTFNLFFNPAFHSKVGIMKYLMPKIKTPNAPDQRRGGDLEKATATGNQAKLNGIIREVAGRHRVYPDNLLPAHRYFGTPREQSVDLLLCVGKGKFDIPASRVKVGDTPLISLGSKASYAIYPPGFSLANEPCAQWWHSAPEVGATSTGSAGLDLKVTFSVDPRAVASLYQFDAYSITIPTGAGTFPAGWTAGMIVRVVAPRPYTVEGGNTIKGALKWMRPFPGMVIEVAGAFGGVFVVNTYTPGVGTAVDAMTLNYPNGSSAGGFPDGAVSLSLGYNGLRYRITAANPSTIALERLTDQGAADPVMWPGFDAFSITNALIELDTSTQEGDWCGPYAACPAGEKTQSIECDFFFPSGLIYIGSDGWVAPSWSVTVEIQYRDMETAGAWVSVMRTYSNSTMDQIGYTESIGLGAAIRPEVRVRRVGAKSTEMNVQDNVQWYGLRSRLTSKLAYEGVTVIAVRILSGGQISNQSDSLINVEATRVLPVRNGLGGWDVESPTRDIVPWVAYVARSVGYSDAEIDLLELDVLGQIWATRGDYYDHSHEGASTAKAAINKALATGFAELTLDQGRITAVRDQLRTTFEEMYTPQNMTKALVRSVDTIQPDDYDGVDVQYVDGNTWTVETVQCRLPGDEGRKVQKVEAAGITDRTRAWRYGMRRRREMAYRRWSMTWGTELDALNSRYLSYVSVSSDVPGWQQSALLLSFTTGNGMTLLESSEPLQWTDAAVHMVAIRKPDGSLSGPYVATRVDDWRLTIGAIDFVPDVSWKIEPPHLQFGPASRWCYPALITDVKPSGTKSVSVSAENYDERVYADDNSFPPVA